MIGTTLRHYQILRRLGEGGMGEVYAAEDTRLSRQVALKVLRPEMAADPERLRRFQREARAVAALSHPNIVTLYSVEEADGVQFLTMELVEGKTLAEVIPEGGLPLGALLELAVPLVEAVAFAHERGIVHRDLKPANVMLAADGRLKVLDFGLAKLRPESSVDETTRLLTVSLTGQAVVGTAAYMSPEQAEGRPVDHRSDIFSLGVILYELACGTRPFGGDTAVSVISAILKDTPRPVSAMNRAVPPALERVITRALAKDPAERYQEAADLRNELMRVRAPSAPRRALSRLVRMAVRSRAARRLAAAALLVGAAVAGWYWLPWQGWFGGRAAAPAFRSVRLTADPGVEQFPSFTPDGQSVVYAGQQSGNWDIYIKRVDVRNPGGEIAKNLTADSPAEDNEPAVSRDGRWIAFRSSREGGGIWVMGIAGGGVRRVTPAGVSDAYNPMWSPDGTEIAYATEDVQLTPLNWEGRADLWVVNVTTGKQRRLLGDGIGVQPDWSPHGHRIAYTARQRQMGIRTVPAKGGDPVAVTDDEYSAWSPRWSADGRYLYFVRAVGAVMNLWRVRIDEVSGRTLGDPQPIATTALFAAHPAFSADGRLIAYCAKEDTSNIWKLALDPATASVVGDPTPVTTGTQAFANPDPTWDGEWVVAYTRERPEGDLYVMRGDGTGPPRQLTNDEALDRVPRFSPDKTWITYFSSVPGEGIGFWKIRFDGSGRQRIRARASIGVWSPNGGRMALNAGRTTCLFDPHRPLEEQTPEELPPPGEDSRPFIAQDWSQDGTQLVGQINFTASRGDGIVVYDFRSRTYERVSEFGEWPSWLPDSRRVLFVADGKDYWVVDTRTKQRTRIYTTPRGGLGPARLTRDGRTAFFPLRLVEADIYLLIPEGESSTR